VNSLRHAFIDSGIYDVANAEQIQEFPAWDMLNNLGRGDGVGAELGREVGGYDSGISV
jgi:hypothetical protein